MALNFFGHKKDKGFSVDNKVQQYHGNGLESIVLMGKPFRVLQKVSDVPAPYMTGRPSHSEDKDKGRFVYLVENSCRLHEFPRHMALKRCVFNVDQVAEAHKEIDILSRVKDKNIVRVYHSEVSRSDGRLGVSIAMEYCSNNLYRRIRSGTGSGAGTRLSESEICHALLAITSAVGYLHTQQPPIAHRDLRPENILINNRYTGPAAFKLTNFSSATTEAYHCQTREEASMAISDIELNTNPGFRSPEMADPWGGKRICEKSDMWSIGVLLYYMMYLKLPFEPTNMALTNNPQVRYPAGSEGRYTGALRVVIDHLLIPDPDKRWDIFALTNFLRFDEDISRHLGTFVFTRTEWPEGWEEQDVKVIGRDQPPKPPPVTYNDELAHETVKEVKEQAEHGRYAENYINDYHGGNEAGSNAPKAIPSTTTHRGTGNAVEDAMMVLGGEDNDDPEMARYREQIIREQQEALDRIRAASGRPPSPPPASSSASHPANSATNSNSPPPPAQPKEQPKKDLFDDLFAGPAEPTPNNGNNNNNNNSGNNNNNNNAPAQKDPFSTDDLFGAPAPTNSNNYNGNQMMMGGGYNANYNNNNTNYANYGNSNFSAPPNNANPNNNFNTGGSWGSGAPAGGGGLNNYGNNNWNNQNNNNNNWNNQNDNSNQNQSTNNASNNANQTTKRKDPFADLFS